MTVHFGQEASVPDGSEGQDSSHTPGPWKACGTIFKHMNAEIRSGSKGEGQGLAQVWDGPNAFRDALVMAAAPEMLAALQGAIGALEFSQDYHRDLGNEDQAFAADRLDAALAAIAKATGTASAPALGTKRSGVNQA